MDDTMENISKYISENPKIIMILIIALIILVIWLYIKPRNGVSNFSPKKDKKKTKTNKEEESNDNEQILKPIVKDTKDPIVSQLVKDINQNS